MGRVSLMNKLLPIKPFKRETTKLLVYIFLVSLTSCAFVGENSKSKPLNSLYEELRFVSLSAVSINGYTLDWLAPARPTITNKSFPVGSGMVRFSRDGRYLIFADGRLFHVTDWKGRIMREIALPKPAQWDFQFTPDWKSVALVSWNQQNGFTKIEIITLPENKITVVKEGTLNLVPSHHVISWAVDSKHFIYEWGDNIFVRRADSSEEEQLLLKGRNPSYSPDGARIQFKSSRDGKITLYQLESKQITTVHYAPQNDCVWSPDSRSLICEDFSRSFSCRLEGMFSLVPALHVKFCVINIPEETMTTVQDYCGGIREEYGWLYTSSP